MTPRTQNEVLHELENIKKHLSPYKIVLKVKKEVYPRTKGKNEALVTVEERF